MTDIKAIETRYNGYRFRSRLEARWAVFFDKCNIRYEYESEGYELPNGEKYLPDFYLPDLDVHVEVKRNTPEGIKEVLKKCDKAISWGGPIKCIVILSDVPKPRTNDGGLWHFPCVYWAPGLPTWGWFFFSDSGELDGGNGEVSFSTFPGSWSTKTIAAQTDAALFKKLLEQLPKRVEFFDRLISIGGSYPDNSGVFDALEAARSARFEHGEGATV